MPPVLYIPFVRTPFSELVLGPKGLVAGGEATDIAGTTEIFGIDFFTESTLYLSSRLQSVRWSPAGLSDALVGYACGGAISMDVDGILFISETSFPASTALAANRGQITGMSGPSAGYLAGGSGSGTILSVIEKLLWSSAVVSPVSSQLPVAMRAAASAQSASKGYSMGGWSDISGLVPRSLIQTVRFDNEAASSLAAVLSLAREAGSGVSSSTHGYTLGGGSEPGFRIDKLSFANDTAAQVASAITQSRSWQAGVYSNTSGYVLGGKTEAAGADKHTTVLKILFATDTAEVLSETLHKKSAFAAGLSYNT